jgi:hypothetical protein
MWWTRILNRTPSRAVGSIRFLERVISPSESHSAEPFRIRKVHPPVQAVESVEPAIGADYRIKRTGPDPLKQCF